MFLPVPQRQCLLASPAVFKTIDHRLFTKKKIITHRGTKWVALPFDDITHTLLARHQLKPPSPIEYMYNWPGRYKPFAHQIETAKFLATYDRAFCFNDMGCVHPDTKIVTENGLTRIADITAPTRVLSWNEKDRKFQLSLSGGAFPKGKETLYRVTTRRGEFVATGHHHIACASGMYRQVSQLRIGERICSGSLPQTTEGLDQLLSTLDAPRYSDTDVGSLKNYADEARRCGQQLLTDQGSDQVFSPPLADALAYGKSCARIFAAPCDFEHKDGLEVLQRERIRPGQWIARQPTQGYYDQREELVAAWAGRAAAQPLKRTLQELHSLILSLEDLRSRELLTGPYINDAIASLGSAYSDYLSESDSSSYTLSSITSDLDEVLSIEPVGEHVYYDMQVLDTNNYVCESGIVHHNSGKTLSALWAADYLVSRGIHQKVLILSPLSTLERVWGDALFESFHHRNYSIVYGSQAKRLEALRKDATFYVMNHDGLKIKAVYDELMSRKDISLVIVDELAVFRNQKTARYKSLWNVAGPDSGRALWGLTGAPMPTGPTDVWAQARLINPGLVPEYFNRFRNELMVQVTQFKWVPKRGWEDKCYSMLKPSIRYSTEECLDLPPISYLTRQVAMSPKQAKVYDEVYKLCVSEAKEGQILALNEGVKILKLLQIATGVVYTSDRDVVDLEPKTKLDELVEIVYETGKKCIVFTPFVHSIEMLYKTLKKKFKTASIHGGVAAGRRNEVFSDFQHGDLEVIVAHPQCMAHGVTLTAACNTIWYAPIDNYEIYEQANARIRRAGQTQHQNIIHLQCCEVEKKIYDRLKSKEKTQGVLLELLKQK